MKKGKKSKFQPCYIPSNASASDPHKHLFFGGGNILESPAAPLSQHLFMSLSRRRRLRSQTDNRCWILITHSLSFGLEIQSNPAISITTREHGIINLIAVLCRKFNLKKAHKASCSLIFPPPKVMAHCQHQHLRGPAAATDCWVSPLHLPP